LESLRLWRRLQKARPLKWRTRRKSRSKAGVVYTAPILSLAASFITNHRNMYSLFIIIIIIHHHSSYCSIPLTYPPVIKQTPIDMRNAAHASEFELLLDHLFFQRGDFVFSLPLPFFSSIPLTW
jgi:hypothetical protein